MDPDVFPGENFNISHSNPALILAYDQDGSIKQDVGFFGYKPYWAFKKTSSGELIRDDHGRPSYDYSKFPANLNSRIEGKEGKSTLNTLNESSYTGPYNIFKNSAFAKDAKAHRCIIPADYFIEGPADVRLEKPFMVRRKDRQPISLAGFYSIVDGKKYFSIMTTPPARLLELGVKHHRSPQLLTLDQEATWLSKEASTTELESVLGKFDSTDFEAIPLSIDIRTPNRIDKPNNSAVLIEPVGEPIDGAVV